MTAICVRIEGRVQGVGFRAWVYDEATAPSARDRREEEKLRQTRPRSGRESRGTRLQPPVCQAKGGPDGSHLGVGVEQGSEKTVTAPRVANEHAVRPNLAETTPTGETPHG